MRKSIVAGLLACAGVQALATSPFILFSTAKLAQSTADHPPIQTNAQVKSTAQDFLSSCPTRQYVLIQNVNTYAQDIRDSTGCKTKHLCRSYDDTRIQRRINVAEVLGEISTYDFQTYIETACVKADKAVTVHRHNAMWLSDSNAKDRSRQVEENDIAFGEVMKQVEGEEDPSYTVIYLSNGRELYAWGPDDFDDDEPVQMELKRSFEGTTTRANSSEPDYLKGKPLFEKYQFFTPGIFMALIAVLVLLMILYAGVSAVASLQIPYGAFEKEMGPAAQKKQM